MWCKLKGTRPDGPRKGSLNEYVAVNPPRLNHLSPSNATFLLFPMSAFRFRVAVVFGQDAEFLLETFGEIVGSGEPHLAGDVGNGSFGCLLEQCGGFFQADVADEVFRRQPGLFLHVAVERDAAHTHVTAQRFHVVFRAVEVLFHFGDGGLKEVVLPPQAGDFLPFQFYLVQPHFLFPLDEAVKHHDSLLQPVDAVEEGGGQAYI